MSTPEPTLVPRAVKPRSHLVLVYLPQGRYRTVRVPDAEGPQDALRLALATLAPPVELGAPDAPTRATVDGAEYAPAAALPAQVFWVPVDASPHERERLAAERVLAHLRALDSALADLAASAVNPLDARAARHEGVAVCETAARVRDLAGRRGGR